MESNGIGVLRSLGRERIPAIGVDCTKDAPGFRSRYCKPLLVPSPISNPKQAVQILIRESQRLRRRAILFPEADAYVLFVSRFREALSKGFLYSLPPKSVIESVVDKQRLCELADRVGTQCPTSYFPHRMQDVTQIKDQLNYPVFIKPRYSHLWREKFRTKGMRINSPSQLVETYEKILKTNLSVIVQEIIPGPESNIYHVYVYVSENSESIVPFVTRKLRQYPRQFGVGTSMVSVHNDEVLDAGLRFIRKIHYVGLGSVEFKLDDRDKTYKMIELNARLPMQNIHATLAGVNFPLIQYMDLSDQLNEPTFDWRDGVKWVDCMQDFLASYEDFSNRQLSFLTWLRSVRNADCHAYFADDDPLPFVQQYLSNLFKAPRFLAERRKRRSATEPEGTKYHAKRITAAQ